MKTTRFKSGKFFLFIVLSLFLFSKDLYCQTFTKITFTEDFIGDTSWTVNNISFELKTDWVEFNDGYLYFGGSLKTSFENFNYPIDSIVMDIANFCIDCFDIVLYKSGQNPVWVSTSIGLSIQSIINPWITNPDSLVMITAEGGIRTQKIYYDDSTERFELNTKEKSIFYPNPAKNEIYFSNYGDKQIQEIKIYNSVGQLLLKDNYPGTKLDISTLANGIYIIKSTIDDKTITDKLLKK